MFSMSIIHSSQLPINTGVGRTTKFVHIRYLILRVFFSSAAVHCTLLWSLTSANAATDQQTLRTVAPPTAPLHLHPTQLISVLELGLRVTGHRVNNFGRVGSGRSGVSVTDLVSDPIYDVGTSSEKEVDVIV